jgi:hypothetical protein
VIDGTQDSSTSCQHRHSTSPYKVCNCTTGTEQQGTATVRTRYRLMDDRTAEDRSIFRHLLIVQCQQTADDGRAAAGVSEDAPSLAIRRAPRPRRRRPWGLGERTALLATVCLTLTQQDRPCNIMWL